MLLVHRQVKLVIYYIWYIHETRWETRYGKQSDYKSALLVDGIAYKFTPGLIELIGKKHTQADKWNSSDFEHIKNLLCRPRVKHSRIGKALLDRMLNGNGSICFGK